MTDIQIRPVVKPAAGIRSGIGIPDHRCATGEQYRQRTASPLLRSLIDLFLDTKRDPFCRTAFQLGEGL